MAVPADLRPLLRRRMWRQYLGELPEPEARLAALQLALKCQAEIDRLRQLLSPGAVSPFALPKLAELALSTSIGKSEPVAPSAEMPTCPRVREAEVAVDPPLTMLHLVDTWRRITKPRAARSIRRMGDVASSFARAAKKQDARQVTREDVMGFREHLEQQKLTRITATNYLQCLHRLFAVAHSEGLIKDNPAAGILMLSTPE